MTKHSVGAGGVVSSRSVGKIDIETFDLQGGGCAEGEGTRHAGARDAGGGHRGPPHAVASAPGHESFKTTAESYAKREAATKFSDFMAELKREAR